MFAYKVKIKKVAYKVKIKKGVFFKLDVEKDYDHVN